MKNPRRITAGVFVDGRKDKTADNKILSHVKGKCKYNLYLTSCIMSVRIQSLVRANNSKVRVACS